MLTIANPNLTGQGAILGTLQYMSPEQLNGGEADARSDIFALGLVLYEMATARRAFEAPSQASLIAAILERDPLPMRAGVSSPASSSAAVSDPLAASGPPLPREGRRRSLAIGARRDARAPDARAAGDDALRADFRCDHAATACAGSSGVDRR